MAYIGRSGWNDLAFDGQIPDDELLEAVDESYRLVVEKLPKKLRPDGLGRLTSGALARSGSPRASRLRVSVREDLARVSGRRPCGLVLRRLELLGLAPLQLLRPVPR